MGSCLNTLRFMLQEQANLEHALQIAYSELV